MVGKAECHSNRANQECCSSHRILELAMVDCVEALQPNLKGELIPPLCVPLEHSSITWILLMGKVFLPEFSDTVCYINQLQHKDNTSYDQPTSLLSIKNSILHFLYWITEIGNQGRFFFSEMLFSLSHLRSCRYIIPHHL